MPARQAAYGLPFRSPLPGRAGSARASRPRLAARPSELIALACLLGVYLAAEALFDRAGVDFTNLAGPLALGAILGTAMIAMIRADPNNVWTALFWFRASSLVYYGFGALVPLVANEATRQYMQGFFLFYADDIAKANVIFVFAIIVVLGSANVFLLATERRATARRSAPPQNRDGGNMLAAGLFFLILGGSAEYLLLVPYIFGMLDFVVPGVATAGSRLIYAAVFLLTAWSREHARRAFPLVAALAAFQLLIGVLAFNKSEVMIALMLFLLALIRRKVTPARLGIVAALAALCFATVVPIVDGGRAELQHRHPGQAGASFTERLEVLREVTANDPSEDGQADDVSWAMTRLSYTNQATFAIHERDSGRPGNTLVNALAVFVPRVLWPEKPIITEIANKFNASATGIATSASSPGLFAEAYWDLGWPGIPLLMCPLGIILAFLSRFAIKVLRSERWIYFPVVLFAMSMGYRTDGYFVPDIAGTSVLAAGLYVILFAVEGSILPLFRRPRRRHRPGAHFHRMRSVPFRPFPGPRRA